MDTRNLRNVTRDCGSEPILHKAGYAQRPDRTPGSHTTLATWMVRTGELVAPPMNLLRDERLDGSYRLRMRHGLTAPSGARPRRLTSARPR